MRNVQPRHVAKYLEGIDRGDVAAAVYIAPDGPDVSADVGTGLVLSNGQVCEFTEDLKGID